MYRSREQQIVEATSRLRECAAREHSAQITVSADDLRLLLAASKDMAEQDAHRIKQLAQTLGECIVLAGITRPNVSLSGPELLLFGQDLKELLERAGAKGTTVRDDLDVDDAKAQLEEATKALIRATERQYPAGSLVNALIGRHVIQGEVYPHSKYKSLHRADEIVITNVKTGARRRITHSQVKAATVVSQKATA
jgi:hypothetical protein